MKPTLFAFLLPTSLLATPVNFDSMPLGSNPNGTYNNEVQITASEEQVAMRGGTHILTLPGHTADMTFGRSIVVDTFSNSFDHDDPIILTITAQFLEPVDHFALRIRDSEGSARLHYTGVDADGSTLSGDLLTSNGGNYFDGILDSNSLKIPAGGYFTGFTIQDADRKTLLDLTFASFDYTLVPEGGVGFLVCVMTFGGLLVLHLTFKSN